MEVREYSAALLEVVRQAREVVVRREVLGNWKAIVNTGTLEVTYEWQRHPLARALDNLDEAIVSLVTAPGRREETK
jgi:hypothetical protein